MQSETRSCQNCKQNFTIEPEDFGFYEKIEVPPPTWCWSCRAQRRLAFRSGRRLYKRIVEGSEKEVFSIFPPEHRIRVMEEKAWWSDAWDPLEYGRNYDFNRSFFDQLLELYYALPTPHRRVLNSVNSDYCNNAIDIKDCYLCFNAGFTEDSLYCETINASKSCVDALEIKRCDSCYEIFDCERCFKVFYSSHCVDCTEVYFSQNLVGCQYCFGCTNLRNKKYHIFNKSHSREEYFRILSSYDLSSATAVNKLREQTKTNAMKFPVKFIQGLHNVEVTGDYLDHSKNVHHSFHCSDLEDCRYCQLVLFVKSKDCMDVSIGGGELCYELQESGGYDVKFSWMCFPKGIVKNASGSKNVQYSIMSYDCSDIFGCVGLRNKQYCIFNTQYPKEEYFQLRDKIISHMKEHPYKDDAGRIYSYGEFFPLEFSPLPYNETWAHEYFPLTKNQAQAKGFYWRDSEARDYGAAHSSEYLPDSIRSSEDGIVNTPIICAHKEQCQDECTGVFKIIPVELGFYRRMTIPLPRLCPNCRHYARAKERNSLQLWRRQCACDYAPYSNVAVHPHHASGHCPNEFETSYAPERPEMVYCESCYNAEVV